MIDFGLRLMYQKKNFATLKIIKLYTFNNIILNKFFKNNAV